MAIAHWLAFGACCLIWGTTWLAIKVGYGSVAPVWGGALRFFVAALAFAFLALLARPRWRPNRTQLFGIVLVGVVFFGGEYGFLYWGEQFLPSATTAVVFSTTPIFAGAFGFLLARGDPWTPRQMLGSVVGLLGVGLMYGTDVRHLPGALQGVLAILASAASAALGSLIGRRWTRDVPVLLLNGGAMLVGALVLLGVSLALQEPIAWPSTRQGWAIVLYLALAGSVLAFLLYFWLLRSWPAHRATLVTLVVPLVALAVGVASGRESYTRMTLVGALVVLTGVAFAMLPSKAAKRAIAPRARDGPAAGPESTR